MDINGTIISAPSDMPEAEITAYYRHARMEAEARFPGERLKVLDITITDDGDIALDYTLEPQRFERIRRITGYLVGTIDRFNNAKRAEEHDRVKHDLMPC